MRRPAPVAIAQVDPDPATAGAPTAAAAPTMVEDADLGAYRRAHETHFRGDNAKEALTAWDAYLAASPTGRFATEARYNRAIVLAKLGRRSEAKEALAPFARGEIAGGYRQREAKALVDAMETP